MCFSTTASFTASVVLGATGVISLSKVTARSQIMFAAIPIFFGIQQASEGILWMSLRNPLYVHWQTFATYFFLFFAQVFWTTWIPVSYLSIETNPLRKKILYTITIAGIIESCILCYRLVFYDVQVGINNHHIQYMIASPKWIILISNILYAISINIAAFISGVKNAKILAVMLAVSLIISKIFYNAYLISVWCFFAALLSIMIIYIMRSFQTDVRSTGQETV